MSFTTFLQLPIAIAAFALIIVPVVVAHEMGHFLAARALRVPVAVFSIGFGPELWGRTSRSGVRWKVSAVPLGGYVSFGGRVVAEPASGSFRDRFLAAPPEDSFTRSEPWRRLLVLLAGPGASILFAAMVFLAVATAFGVPAPGVAVLTVEAGGAAAAAGIQPGDRLTSVAGETAERTILEVIGSSAGRTLPVTLLRGDRVVATSVAVASKTIATSLGPKAIGRIGISLTRGPRRFDPIGAVGSTWDYMRFLAGLTSGFLVDLVHGRASVADVSSPVGIATISGKLIQNNVEMFIRFAGAISFALGVTNLFPVPGLDGGQSLIAVMEMVARHRFSARVVAGVNLGGLALAFGFMLFVMAGEVGSVVSSAFAH